ncbi:MAG: YlmC/YmxH family sporulation protein [Clostridia bacterium]|jgi:YlmC/YmxH family sporulation protein|nr:YlmC/YmxH family sporulation protein [Clostridia bacterium]MDH7572368.1 YlmC/YmxH family sporulation protein [Clostridia bacterium]
MKLSEFIGKEIVNVHDGTRLGVVGEADLLLDGETGAIEAIVVPGRGGLMGLWPDRQPVVIPWTAVKKIGTELIIVDLGQAHLRRHYPF